MDITLILESNAAAQAMVDVEYGYNTDPGVQCSSQAMLDAGYGHEADPRFQWDLAAAAEAMVDVELYEHEAEESSEEEADLDCNCKPNIDIWNDVDGFRLLKEGQAPLECSTEESARIKTST
jgi:hypothetical protein